MLKTPDYSRIFPEAMRKTLSLGSFAQMSYGGGSTEGAMVKGYEGSPSDTRNTRLPNGP